MTTTHSRRDLLAISEPFVNRHIGPSESDVEAMLKTVNYPSLDALVDATIPDAIRCQKPLEMPSAVTESEIVAEAAELASRNRMMRPFIGLGYHPCITPPVIQRNVLENPNWYTQYTPYQAEISQGRLEALLNFQTLVSDLTGLAIANSSLLDEGTAAAEAMAMAHGVARGKKKTFLVADDCHPQTLDVIRTRAEPLGIDVVVADVDAFVFNDDVSAVLVQNPSTHGKVRDFTSLAGEAHDHQAMVIIAADPLSLVMLKSPAAMGADIAVGTMQRFGVPLGFGGPHAAYFATKEAHKRRIPGRIVGVSVDVDGNPALRLALQTREQHIRRDRATSNICTSQVLLAVMASMYAVYHGPHGLRRIAERVMLLTDTLRKALVGMGYDVDSGAVFDSIRVTIAGAERARVLTMIEKRGFELRSDEADSLIISLDEATTNQQLHALIEAFASEPLSVEAYDAMLAQGSVDLTDELGRQDVILTHPVFNSYYSEHEMLRYITKLASRDLSLTTSMIPLGSCTMKLNATTEMLPITMPGFCDIHPFTAAKHMEGYRHLITEMECLLAEITGLPGVSLQPNAGSQGEYAGLLAIRNYHKAQGELDRDICLIPGSAHGTNPASAVMAGMKVAVVGCDDHGNIDLNDLRAKAEKHVGRLGAVMVTYPSTHGVFEDTIVSICDIVHQAGGQVYMDGANMNAQVGLCRPGDFGIDVCHLNLHKTFCIPHGGGGPGVGPIAVAEHLRPHLPGHRLMEGQQGGAIAAAPWGSAGILPISWTYIRLLGTAGLTRASQVAILNANYLMKRLEGAYKILYTGENGTCAHEFILDLRPLKKETDISVADVAKRLMDYGFHAPTMSWPVAGTLMVEPTESESKVELDRFADALLAIREEIRDVAEGKAEKGNNVVCRAPHTAQSIADDQWDRPYSRSLAAFPCEAVKQHKFWPAVGRIDDAHGDRNLVCTCLPLDAYEDQA